MSVNDAAHQAQGPIGQIPECPLQRSHAPPVASRDHAKLRTSHPEVSEFRTTGAPVILEPDQTLVILVRSAQVEHLQSILLGFLNSPPEQHVNAPEIMKSCIGASVLINQRVLIAQSQDSSYGPASLVCDPDFQGIAKTLDQGLEPFSRLRRNRVAPPGHNKQFEEMIEQLRRTSLFVSQAFALSSADLPLRRTFVKALKNRLQVWLKVDLMQVVN
jgi:hypothetical protein